MTVDAAVVQAMYGLSSLSGVLIAAIVWRHRDEPGAMPLLGSVCGACWWSTVLFLATVVSDYGLSQWLSRSVYLGVVVVVASIFLFALEYTGREEYVTRRAVALLSVQPVVVVALALTNPRNVFFASVAPDPTSATGVAIAFGPGFWLHTLYSYALLAVGTAFVVGMLYRSRAVYRGQVVVLVAAVVSPTLGNLATIVGPISFDSTPVGFVVANALFAVAITRYRLIDLSPIARDRVLDEISDAVFVVDVEGRVIDVNDRGTAIAEETLGRSSLVGEPVEDVLAETPAVADIYRQLVADQEPREVEFPMGERHYTARATPIDDGRGRHVGWLFLVRDVTERERREAELRRRNEQLDRFASVVSHDLRNPLGVAKGFTDLAEETGDPEHFAEVRQAHDRMETIVEDVLALAREGQVVADPRPVGLGGVAEDAWDAVDTEGATLRVADAPTVEADPDRLSRLLENLFRNALEHGVPDAAAAADGGRSLTVAVGADDDGFYVADDGVGIPPDERERVLESGYSGADGTGFGLSIVQEIAEGHGWTVAVEESESGGARFAFADVTVSGESTVDGEDGSEGEGGRET